MSKIKITQNNIALKWGLFILLALIWGSSFELMKLGLYENNDFAKPVLSAYQVAAFRLFFGGLVILPYGLNAYRLIPPDKRNYAILSGVLGSFIPAFLFCLAETKLTGSFAGTLNSLTPIFVLLVGAFFFGFRPQRVHVIGIIISFVGSIALFFARGGNTGDLLYVGFVLIATFFYGLNVNMVMNKLKSVPSMQIAALAFSFLTIPAGIVLLLCNTQQLNFSSVAIQKGIAASATLGILGTTIASILFYSLMKKAGGVFASAVTYAIPFVAMGWDIVHGEHFKAPVWICLIIILLGIYVINYQPKKKEVTNTST